MQRDRAEPCNYTHFIHQHGRRIATDGSPGFKTNTHVYIKQRATTWHTFRVYNGLFSRCSFHFMEKYSLRGKTTIAKWKTSAPFQTQQEFVTYVSSVNLWLGCLTVSLEERLQKNERWESRFCCRSSKLLWKNLDSFTRRRRYSEKHSVGAWMCQLLWLFICRSILQTLYDHRLSIKLITRTLMWRFLQWKCQTHE